MDEVNAPSVQAKATAQPEQSEGESDSESDREESEQPLVAPKLVLSKVIRTDTYPTASYYVILKPDGDLVLGVHDSAIIDRISSDCIIENTELIYNSSLVALDTNINISTLATAVNLAVDHSVPVWVEPTSTHKTNRIIESGKLAQLFGITPNFKELIMLSNELQNLKAKSKNQELGDKIRLRDTSTFDLDSILQQCLELSPALIEQVPNMIVKLGSHGVLLVQRLAPNAPKGDAVSELKATRFPRRYVPHPAQTPYRVRAVHYAAFPTAEESWNWGSEGVGGFATETERTGAPHIINVSGAGDCFVGGLIHGIVREWSIDLAIKCGLRAANLSVQSLLSVPKFITEKEMNAEEIAKWGGKLKVTQIL